MGNDVFANGREVSCKAADGKAIASFPDVCFTPPENPATPPGVPIPYPNTGMATDATSGSKKVKISNKEVMLKNKSYFKKSMGDEAGSAAKKGVITSVNRGKVYFTSWSMDVKFEGQNVVRHLDLTTHNHASQPGQTPPWPYADTMAMGQIDNGCEGLDSKAEKELEKLGKKERDKSVTVAVSRFEHPTGQLDLFAPPASSNVSSSRIKWGGKFGNYASGLGGQESESNVITCDGEKFQYKESSRPKSGHAEAKIIEDTFIKFASKSTGRPRGKLFIKIKHTKDPNWPNCPECKRLRDEINNKKNGDKCDDFEVIFCDDTA